MAKGTSRKPTPRSRGGAGARPASGTAARVGRPAAPKPKAAPKKVAPKPKTAPRLTSKPKAALKPQRRPTPNPVTAQGGSPRPSSVAGRLGAAVSGAASRVRPGSRPSAASGRERRERHQRGQLLRTAALVAGGVVALALVGVLVLLVLRATPLFQITFVEIEPSEHVSVDDVASLVQVPEGATLLNVDTASIEESIKKDPWVGSVSFERIFPDTLKIHITDQSPDMLVVMSSGTVGWYLGTEGTWIEPTRIQVAEGQSVADAALAIAESEGCLLVTDVPATVNPEASALATDEVLEAVREFRDGFSDDFAAHIVRFSAPSTDNISCTLDNGVEVSLGSPTDIADKEAVISELLSQHEGTILSINVRVVSNPAFREIASDSVQQGTGIETTLPAEQDTSGQDGAASPDGTDAAATEGEAEASDDDAAA